MNTAKALLAISAALLLSSASTRAQSAFKLLFRGTLYQTNGLGKVLAMPISEETLLQDAGAAGGIDPKTLALAYHINGSSYGDTIEVVNGATYQSYTTLFGLFFGDDSAQPNQPVGRTAITNSPPTEERRVDYVYMFQNSTFTSFNTHSMGATFTTKRHQTDSLGNVRTVIDARMHWVVNPSGNSGTKIIDGTFTTTKQLF